MSLGRKLAEINWNAESEKMMRPRSDYRSGFADMSDWLKMMYDSYVDLILQCSRLHVCYAAKMGLVSGKACHDVLIPLSLNHTTYMVRARGKRKIIRKELPLLSIWM